MDDQPFNYFQHSSAFNSFSGSEYPPSSFGADYTANDDNPFIDPNYERTHSQSSTPSWSASFSTPDASTLCFQRRGAVSAAVPEQPAPEEGCNTVPRALRIDTGGGDDGGEQHVQEVSANLASPLNIRPPHSDIATTPTSFPPGPNTYDTSTAPVSYDMNHDHTRGMLPLPLAMPQNTTYFVGHQGFDHQQVPQPQSALPVHPSHQRQSQGPISPYGPLHSPQLRMHPVTGSSYGPPSQPGLTIPYTPSSIASSSVRSVSPASTAATSAQPVDFSTYASPVGDYDMSSGECAVPASSLSSLTITNGSPHSSTAPMHSPVARQLGPTHPAPSAVRSSTMPGRSAASHSASPIRRRANKQRLDDARRKEICTYARDRPKARQEDIALRYGVERSTISKILKNKDKWLSIDTQSSGRKPVLAKHGLPICARPSKFPEIETELLKWVKECQENGVNITDTRIKAKARECAAEIGLPEGKFKASSGWIENFKIRNSLTRRAQDERDMSPLNEGSADLDPMDEDEEPPIPASQATQAEEGNGYDVNASAHDSFSSLGAGSTEMEAGMLPHDNSFSTFSTDSMVSSQDLSLSTPLSSTASSFASSPSALLPQHLKPASSLRARGHSHSFAMRAVGSSGSPQPGASPIQPLSPARLDMRFASTPTSVSIPRFPSPLSASTSASGNPLVMVHGARRSPVSQKHSRHPSDASGFSYDVLSQTSNDPSSGYGTPLFETPSSHQALDALDTILRYFQQPQTAGIASQLDYNTFSAVRTRLAERLVQSLPPGAESGAPSSENGHS